MQTGKAGSTRYTELLMRIVDVCDPGTRSKLQTEGIERLPRVTMTTMMCLLVLEMASKMW